MGWLRLDDKWDDHPKIVTAGRDAAWFHLRALLFCARQETDGHIPDAHVDRVGSDFTSSARKKLVARLVEVGLWEPDPNGDGWWIHDYLEYNPSSSRRDAERAAARERVAKAREKKRRSSDDVRANTSRSSRDVRSTPTPTPVVTSESEEPAVGNPNRNSLRWTGPDDQDRTYAAEHKPGVDVDLVYEKWVNHCAARDLTFFDPRAEFRNWLLNERTGPQGTEPKRPRIDRETCVDCEGSGQILDENGDAFACPTCNKRAAIGAQR